jgi:cellulose synthase/poly-beta-1,6-N-acetylglucosamine synthase-like glycosyltransferase
LIFQLSPTQLTILILATIITILLGIYAINYSLLAIISLGLRKNKSAPPKIFDWPTVSIHIPLYNEKNVISRLIKSCINFDYPRDKFNIIIIDDSNDGTTEIVKSYEKKHPDILKVIQRDQRYGYKAGALQKALENTNSELIAIFDADYVPPKDFLKQMVPFFYKDEKIAFVQARCTYLNRNFSWVTKAISLGIDGYCFVEQKARHSANLLAHFSGTGGIFKRKAIECVGGWQSDTLAEDLDLSIRMQLNGWKYCYLPDVICPGEIPPKMKIFIQQQYRWAKGFTQCFLKHWKKVIKCKNLTCFQKFEALMQLGTYFVYPFSLIAMLCSITLFFIFPLNFFFNEFWGFTFGPIISMISAVIYCSPFIFYGTAISELNRLYKNQTTSLKRIFYIPFLGILTMLSNTRAILEGLLLKDSPFNRTYKYGLVD